MTTTLNCLPWMQNQDEQTPCTTAQEVGQLCNQGYTVSVANFLENDYVPNTTTTDGCTCSWSIYNLLSACSYCVGQLEYASWGAWIADCGSYASDTAYLPSGLSLSQGLPFWAATNPSTWENAIFNITQAANIAEQAKPDVTGGPLPTSTTTASSTSSVSTGAIVGGVIGAIVVIIIGGLLIFCLVRRRRRQRTHPAPTGIPSFSASQPAAVPSTWNGAPVQPTLAPYFRPPVHSTTSRAPMSLASPVPPGFSSSGHSAAPPIVDAADMITPFLATSSRSQTSRPDTSPPSAAEALSKRAITPPRRRVRLNPPPYSATAVPGLSGAAAALPRRLSTNKHKKRKRKMSGTAIQSGTNDTTSHSGLPTEDSRPLPAVPDRGTGSDGGGGGGIAEVTHDGTTGGSDQRSPEV